MRNDGGLYMTSPVKSVLRGVWTSFGVEGEGMIGLRVTLQRVGHGQDRDRNALGTDSDGRALQIFVDLRSSRRRWDRVRSSTSTYFGEPTWLKDIPSPLFYPRNTALWFP